MGGDRYARRALREERSRQWGARHSRLVLIIVVVALAGVIALCGEQLSYGTYLGRGWMIAAVAGMAAAAGLSAGVFISRRSHSRATGRLVVAWLVLGVISASGVRFPFPQGPYGRVQAFFNVVHAALLGYAAMTCTAILVLFAYLLLHPRGRARVRQAARAGREPGPAGSQPGSGSVEPGQLCGGPGT